MFKDIVGALQEDHSIKIINKWSVSQRPILSLEKNAHEP